MEDLDAIVKEADGPLASLRARHETLVEELKENKRQVKKRSGRRSAGAPSRRKRGSVNFCRR